MLMDLLLAIGWTVVDNDGGQLLRIAEADAVVAVALAAVAGALRLRRTLAPVPLISASAATLGAAAWIWTILGGARDIHTLPVALVGIAALVRVRSR